MKRLMIALTLTLSAIAHTAHAATDFRCVQNCQGAGYPYGLCMRQCTFGQSGQPDPQCTMNCVMGGTELTRCQMQCQR